MSWWAELFESQKQKKSKIKLESKFSFRTILSCYSCGGGNIWPDRPTWKNKEKKNDYRSLLWSANENTIHWRMKWSRNWDAHFFQFNHLMFVVMWIFIQITIPIKLTVTKHLESSPPALAFYIGYLTLFWYIQPKESCSFDDYHFVWWWWWWYKSESIECIGFINY